MNKFLIKTRSKKVLADIITPVSIYLKIRDLYPNSIMLESSDYHANKDAFSFICFSAVSCFSIENKQIKTSFPDGSVNSEPFSFEISVEQKIMNFMAAFELEDKSNKNINGLFGYTTFDAVQYFETIRFKNEIKKDYYIPEIKYCFYKFIIAIDHFKNELTIIENFFGDEPSQLDEIENLLKYKSFGTFHFETCGNESSNLTDDEYKKMVSKGKEHCFRGDVIQIVLSRQFSQTFKGDDFNVYRALRSINPSPYLFYFDYGSYKIFGSSPESQLVIKEGKAYISPIAGTYKRTGDDKADKVLAEKLVNDEKEKAEHVMLVDLARNDLGRNCDNVRVDTYSEVQYYSHVLHLVSKVSGDLHNNTNVIRVMGDSFPAGTLSGAPKYKAMELIDKYENQNRSYYGGCIGQIGFDGSFNHAIMIRSFLSKNNTLYFQAGAGIVSESKEESELAEVNNKLAALKKAIEMAKNF